MRATNVRLLLKLLTFFLVASYPAIIGIDITDLNVKKGFIEVEGLITINPLEVPPEYQYNHEYMLQWYEENIQTILDDNGFGFIEVSELELEWKEIDNDKGYDIIGFKVKARVKL